MNPTTINLQKVNAAKRAVSYIQDGMCLGLGSGSTSEIALGLIAEKVRNGLNIKGIPSSEQVAALAREHGIPLTDYEQVEQLDLNLDGADEVDQNFQLIKGGGGAMLREKINATAARTNIIMVDERKMVTTLGAFPLPVETTIFGHQQVLRTIRQKYNVECNFRQKSNEQYITDNGNLIIDCYFQKIPDPKALDQQLKSIPGVVETGIFIDLTHMVIVGSEEVKVIENTLISG